MGSDTEMGGFWEISYQNLGLQKVHNANLDATVPRLKKMMTFERLLQYRDHGNK